MKLRRTLLTLLPKLALSRSTGLLTRLPLPSALRAPFYKRFARRYGVDLHEVALPLDQYRSFRDFFIRQLPDGARPVDSTSPLVWPSDSRIVSSGSIAGGRILQVKGHDYSLRDLVVDPVLAAALDNGSQATLYLSPRDYHRVHAPFDAVCSAKHHVPGKLFPVNPGAQDAIPDLFARNERLVLEMRLASGQVGAVVFVAALNVGDIVFEHSLPQRFERGDELGYFAFGSTIIVLLGPGPLRITEQARDTVVKMGAALPCETSGTAHLHERED